MRPLTFLDLDRWAGDDLSETLAVYSQTLPDAFPAPTATDARAFFEHAFRPVLIDASARITGYYEPELVGSLQRTDRFRWPLHACPADHTPKAPRAELLDRQSLDGHELVWLDDPLDAYLSQVQGSVRVRIVGSDRILRLGYAGRNGLPYRSIGAELVAQGAIAAQDISIQTIRAWCCANPDDVGRLFRMNPSYVFFRLLDLPPELGPIGTSGQPLTAMRSLAADPAFIQPGTPIWIETDGPESIHRLFIAQDTGSAIIGPGRVDLYIGAGAEAGERASRMNQTGRVVALRPHEHVT